MYCITVLVLVDVSALQPVIDIASVLIGPPLISMATKHATLECLYQ